uniref:Uncharacterized protein n=1 Tax=Panagrolaimus davidi TaxID=227884 RepID=A0A914QPW5_9BILA
MAYLNKLAPSGAAFARLIVGKLRLKSLTLQAVRLSHANIYRQRRRQISRRDILRLVATSMNPVFTIPCAYMYKVKSVLF